MLEFEINNKKNANILVVGVGGGGCNAVNRMIADELEGVEFVGINTDKQALEACKADRKLQIGSKLTGGLGAGGNPQIGQKSAEENEEEISEELEGCEMVFVTAGMGGGTGTGAASIVARLAKDMGILTIAVVSTPFMFEGSKRAEHAAKGINYLKQCVDSIVIVPNDKLLELSDEQTTLLDAFKLADSVLMHGVQGITDLITKEGMINLDFSDVETVMRDKGIAHMGIGTGSGADKAKDAVEMAINSPLIETKLEGATAVLANVIGGHDMTMVEVSEAGERIKEEAAENAIIIFGTTIDPEMKDSVNITLIATGFDNKPVDYDSDINFVNADYKKASSSTQSDSTDDKNQEEAAKDFSEVRRKEESQFTVPNFLSKKKD